MSCFCQPSSSSDVHVVGSPGWKPLPGPVSLAETGGSESCALLCQICDVRNPDGNLPPREKRDCYLPNNISVCNHVRSLFNMYSSVWNIVAFGRRRTSQFWFAELLWWPFSGFGFNEVWNQGLADLSTYDYHPKETLLFDYSLKLFNDNCRLWKRHLSI